MLNKVMNFNNAVAVMSTRRDENDIVQNVGSWIL